MNKTKINMDQFEAIKTIAYVRGILKGINGYRDEKDQTAIMLADCSCLLLEAERKIRNDIEEVDVDCII